ncbi:MAG: hypothetical protein U0840_24715 [Gemmataceae bacterium]
MSRSTILVYPRLACGLVLIVALGLTCGCGEKAARNTAPSHSEADPGRAKDKSARDDKASPPAATSEAPPPPPVNGTPAPMAPRPAPEQAGEGSGSGLTGRASVTREKGLQGAAGSGPGRPSDKAPAKEEKTGQPSKGPVVWKRDGAQPTFARVYVGDGNSLELVSLQVTVLIEGPRARTLVDHVFRNPHARQLEGTFEYPLPAGASPSYYAMFLGATRADLPRFKPPEAQGDKPVMLPEMLPPAQLARAVDVADWGKLQEARIVAPERGREAYEEIVRGQIDPALLEYASGNTFRGRVFPIAPGGYNRVILAYEETLPVMAERLVYRYALPTCKLQELRFSLQAGARECLDVTVQPKEARRETTDERIHVSHAWSNTTPGGEVLFSTRPASPMMQTVSGTHRENGPVYFYARVRPKLDEVPTAEPSSQHAVFLLDTSQSEFPERFRISMKLLLAILEADPDIKQFNVLAFNAAPAWVEPKGWLPNTKEGRDTALGRLDGVMLEGATDLGAALDQVVKPSFTKNADVPLSCFLLSDGHLTWGETEAAPLVARFRKRLLAPARFFCYRTGLGQENAELFEALTRDGGGVFQVYGEAEVAPAARAHRRQALLVDQVRVEGSLAAREVLVGGRRTAIYPQGDLIVTGHCAKPGTGTIVVEGTFAGKRYTQKFPLEVRPGGELAGRAWGEVAVASLLALNDPWVEELVTAYGQEFNIASRAGSFLVLEREEDYKRFQLEDLRQKTVKTDLDSWLNDAWAHLAKEPSIKQAFGRLLFQIDGATKVLTGSSGQVKTMLDLLSEADCTLPVAELRGAIVAEKDAHRPYLEARQMDRRAVAVYLEESQRRQGEADLDGAVRVLSTVIEEHPGRGDALRLVGYRLLDLRQPALAARLFSQVLRQRPFEPHSFRDLARSLEESGKQPLAALLYEAVLAGTWHNRFGEALKVVTREDYTRALRAGLRDGQLSPPQREYFKKRLEELQGTDDVADLRVSISWNTDATDIDLWVIEPDRTKVFYSSPQSPSGGKLSQDQTQGYGPERYQIRHARKGEYQLLVHYYRANRNLLGGETHVNVTITRNAGTDREKVERRTVILKREGELVPVMRLQQ